MKKLPIVILHVSYWFIFLNLFSLYYNAMNYPAYVFLPVLPDKEIFSALGIVILIPSVLAFYTGYSYLFGKFLMPGRYAILVVSTAAVTFLCMGLMAVFPFFGNKLFFEEMSTSAYGFYLTHYEHYVPFLALLNCAAGIVLKGFAHWLKNSSRPAAPLTAT